MGKKGNVTQHSSQYVFDKSSMFAIRAERLRNVKTKIKYMIQEWCQFVTYNVHGLVHEVTSFSCHSNVRITKVSVEIPITWVSSIKRTRQ